MPRGPFSSDHQASEGYPLLHGPKRSARANPKRSINLVIKPHVIGAKVCDRCEKTPRASGVTWKGLYAGRRGAVTAIIKATNGNYAAAQRIDRHKSMTTTLNVYKKQITRHGLLAGTEQFQKSLTK
jgi:hypothetical protein